MSYNLSPNMSLPIPAVGTEPGPQYATDVNNSFSLVDAHTHLPGSGVYITPGAIDINAALTFNNNLATNLQAVQFQLQSTSIPIAGSIFTMTGAETIPRQDLFYYDGTTQIQLTAGGNVNATAANIPGESYAGGTFTWKQGTGSTTPANFDIGSVTLRPNTAGTINGVTLTPPSGIATAFNVALPNPPVNPSFLQIDGSGNMSATIPISGGITSTNIAANTITGGTSGNLALAAVTNANIAAQTITQGLLATRSTGVTVAAGGVAVNGGNFSTSSTTYTAVTSVTITTTGRPVMLMLIPNGTSASFLSLSGSVNGTFSWSGFLALDNGIGANYYQEYVVNSDIPAVASPQYCIPLPGTFALDMVPAGTYTYTLFAKVAFVTSTPTFTISEFNLVGYEL